MRCSIKSSIDCHLGGAHVDEVNLAVLHLQATQTNDLLLCDRGYASSQWLATGVKPEVFATLFITNLATGVKPEVFATLFITNLESVLTEEDTTRLEEKSSEHFRTQRVNQAVSFNAIRNYVSALFSLEENPEELLRKLTQLFLTNPGCVRPQRPVPRRQCSTTQRLNYPRRIKTILFLKTIFLNLRALRVARGKGAANGTWRPGGEAE